MNTPVDSIVEKPGLSRRAHNAENAGSNPAGATNSHKAGRQMAPRQVAGCLPKGYDDNSLLTPEQFATWRQLKPSTVRAMLPTMKGVLRRSREDVRIHVRSFLAANLK